MRDITVVIGYMAEEIIPEAESGLKATLTAIAKTAMYLPPEMQGKVWGHLGATLAAECGAADTDWKRSVQLLMQDREKVPKGWKPK